ncbi:threonine/serine dehydratase [Actinospica sp. MGRD01-02]|uniref:Threonine/serine dehydratase n=1 Tax=Actinospica acidithermotolerans TaxID=2828514 RepID=A0A941IKI6_9ACTN|nr:threonine/serine dehydratase [Actinospica acidithermotolerans]MBR7826751.1 threonine/serine dehydratase [Actinospica acidithermotolerans]
MSAPAAGLDPSPLGPSDVKAAQDRIAGRVRPLAVAPADTDLHPGRRVTFALEYMQHTGSFKARGAANLAGFHLRGGTMPEAGIAIASGGNAGLACAWAARATQTRATVFVPETAPAFKVAKLRGYGADVRLVGTEYAHALAASIEFARESGALLSHAYDNPLIAAGAGTIATELLGQVPDVDTIVVSVGGGGLFSGIAAAVADSPIRVVAVEPENCRALNASLEAGRPVDVAVDSVAADALGARRVSRMAFDLAQSPNVTSLLVTDDAIMQARRDLWDRRRVVVEPGGATAFAALSQGVYVPEEDEHVAVILCGANTDPASVLA